jgi:hypothetical protein
LSSISLTITPIGGGFTNLTVSGGPQWPHGDTARFHVSVGSVIVNDHFDDGNIGTNTSGTGGGWNQFFNGMTHAETGSNWVLTNGTYDWSSGGIRSKSAGTFQVMTTDGAKIEWGISDVTINAVDSHTKDQFPGGKLCDCRYELGITSVNRTGSVADLFDNDKGGLYIDLFFDATAVVPTHTVAVTGNIRAINRNHPLSADGEGSAGLETVATFTLTNVTSVSAATPLIVSAVVNQTGWTIAFANNVNVDWVVDATAHPGVIANNGRLTGGWDAGSLADAAITTEFANGANLNVLFQGTWSGRGNASLDYAKVCVGCPLSTDCPDPFADINSDGYVDQADFGLFQRCWTGAAGGIPDGCRCLDHSGNGGIDIEDFQAFLICAAQSGPTIPVPKSCDN